MQRSKAAVGVEVKRVIGALCRLLAASGLPAVPAPDTFRRAKFGEVGAEDEFWQLLANICQTTTDVSSEGSRRIKQASEHRKLVAAALWQTGYHADWMYMSEGGGSSRDLLLALGWLLATGTLEKLLTQRVQRLDKTLLTPPPVSRPVSQEVQVDSSSLRRLQWLIGCLRHQGRSLLSVQEERAGLLHAIVSGSCSSSTSSSSSSDQSSAVLIQDSARTQELCDLLESYLNWKQVEKVFWSWMDSVVDCHQKDPVVKRGTHSANRRAAVCHHGNRGLEDLEHMRLRLPTSQERQRRGQGPVEDRGQMSPSLSSLPLSQAYRARLQAERPPVHGSRGRAEDPDDLPASQAARLLLQVEDGLLDRRDRQRLANKVQLQDLIGRLDHVVLIPP